MDDLQRDMEPDFLRLLRAVAAEKASNLPMPDRSSHRWRYTSPALLVPDGAILPVLAASSADFQPDIGLSEEARAAGVSAMTFPDALRMMPVVVANHLGRLAGPSDPFLALNLATFKAGAVVVIPDGVHVEAPIRIRHVMPCFDTTSMNTARILIVAGSNCRATVISEIAQDRGYGNLVTELFVGDGATLLFGSMESNGSGVTYTRVEHRVGERAALTHMHVLTPSGLLKTEVRTHIAGKDASVEGLALIVAGGQSRADYRVLEDHAQAHSKSHVTVRAVGSGHAHIAFTGLLRVQENTPGCEAFEEARALLLSDHAVANLIPELEILNHDVACSHAAAISPLDAEARYYLMTRGLTAREAESMLVEGFAEPVLSRIPDLSLVASVRTRLLNDLIGA